MIIKGSARGGSATDIRRLADHLLDVENEEVTVAEVRGTTASDLHGTLAEMRAVSLGTRTRRSVYHASLNVGRDEVAAMTVPLPRCPAPPTSRFPPVPACEVRHVRRDDADPARLCRLA